MDEKIELTKKTMLASMDEIVISTEECPIVGTSSLATCVGVLVYSEAHKKAIACHASGNPVAIVNAIIDLAIKNNLMDSPVKYRVIPGYYYNHYQLAEEISDLLWELRPYFSLMVHPEENAIMKDPELPAMRFAFDASTGTFVTDKVLYGKDYLDIKQQQKNK
ncbi:MAG: hypothetical protein IJO63_03395 [Bacilli bacterium]|nr:hypothetical protein [Bacilli bacterium]